MGSVHGLRQNEEIAESLEAGVGLAAVLLWGESLDPEIVCFLSFEEMMMMVEDNGFGGFYLKCGNEKLTVL